MLAVVCRALTGLDGLSIEELPAPEPGPGEVRIRVRAAGLNFADTLIISGRYQERPALPFVRMALRAAATRAIRPRRFADRCACPAGARCDAARRGSRRSARWAACLRDREPPRGLRRR